MMRLSQQSPVGQGTEWGIVSHSQEIVGLLSAGPSDDLHLILEQAAALHLLIGQPGPTTQPLTSGSDHFVESRALNDSQADTAEAYDTTLLQPVSRLTASPGDPAAANEEADDGTFPDDAEAGEAEDSSEGEGEEDPMITLKQMRQLNGGRQEYVGPMAGCTAVVALVSGSCLQ